ncbi:MAG: 5-(carboxyamino)imidazole ribonucleotide synthase [Myxococcales bacterium]|nr:5-(carboxyamino)imidazole ribonucleotide synthase [Myxococcales bacterium]MCB9534436.1 5-(carboxyamino)imidazole ribonucleotide synthase [Myxococcales bacterium]
MSRVPFGGTIGVIGGGQLARMMAVEALRMDLRVAVLDPDPACSAAPLATHLVTGALDDRDAAFRLAELSDVVTVDTEHVPADLLASLETRVAVRPGSKVLHTVQDRLVQREFLATNGFPQVEYREVSDATALRTAASELGHSAVLKTRRFGYDGRGQARIQSVDAVDAAWDAIGQRPAVMESFIRFDKEVSVILARGLDGDVRTFPVAENVHEKHVLHTTRAPAVLSQRLAAAAVEIAVGIAEALDHVGTMAIELFVVGDDRLLVNEIAPRTHNSGHFTFGACATSQFEQHVRAICGWPLGDPSLLRPAALLNLLGDLWSAGPPDWDPVLAEPGASLHLYGKNGARPGRKMGHVLVLDDDADVALQKAQTISTRLGC